jgi:3-hydroxyisobutyrate dehydrogenase-like beta-hydroxyacid dehydrogenase
MGYAIAHRLREQGFEIVGWDHSADAGKALAADGFKIVDDAASVASEADIILSSITDDAGARGLFEGAHGFFSVPVEGKLFVEMSTLQPMTVRELADLAEAQGARLIDCPVLGSIPTVREGKLLVLAGGHADDVERARPVLNALARKIVHLGLNGAGSAMKLSVNLGLAAYLQSLAESLALGLRQGLKIEQMLEVLSEAPTANLMLASKMAVLKGGDGSTTLDIATLRKDVMSAVATGAMSGVAMPVSASALAALSAAVAAGWDSKDIGLLPRFFEQHMLQRFVT